MNRCTSHAVIDGTGMGCFEEAGHAGLHWQNNGCCRSGRLHWAQTPATALHSLKTILKEIGTTAGLIDRMRLKADRVVAAGRVESLTEKCEQLVKQLSMGAFPEPITPQTTGDRERQAGR